jgi:hypothetical protein
MVLCSRLETQSKRITLRLKRSNSKTKTKEFLLQQCEKFPSSRNYNLTLTSLSIFLSMQLEISGLRTSIKKIESHLWIGRLRYEKIFSRKQDNCDIIPSETAIVPALQWIKLLPLSKNHSPRSKTSKSSNWQKWHS